MKVVLQRVRQAEVLIDHEIVGRIGGGLLVLVGIAPQDDQTVASRMLDKLLACRVFEDEQGRMNLDLRQTAGGLLLVPNFTLMADTRKGTRPGFSAAADPAQARPLFDWMCEQARERHEAVASGVFGADMQVALVNDGPVTLLLEL